jgi:hypothetical protein
VLPPLRPSAHLPLWREALEASACIRFYINPRTVSLSGGLRCRFDREEMNRKVYALGQEESNCGPRPATHILFTTFIFFVSRRAGYQKK